MIDLTETDFVSFEEFVLRDRFVEHRREAVSPDVLLRVRPLVAGRAETLAPIAAGLCAGGTARAVTFRSDDQPASITDRLRELPPAADCPVIVLWNPTTAALTDWALFTARWDQFCHAGSDDLVAWPPTGTWHLCYRRYDVFQFQSRLSAR